MTQAQIKSMVVEGQAYNTQGRLLLRPKGVAHAVEVLLHAPAGNLGVKKLSDKFKEWYTANKDRKLTETTVRICHGCQVGQDYSHKPVSQGQIPSAYLWHTLSVDIMGSLATCESLCCIIIFLDIFSRYCVLIPSTDHTALMVARVLVDRVITYFGTPTHI